MSGSYRNALTAAVFAVLMLSASGIAAELTLAEGGAARATIVIADNPTPQAAEAAAVLKDYLGRITGAEFTIARVSEATDGTRILVGRSPAVEALGVGVPSGYTPQMNEEGFVIKTTGTTLVLAGNEDWNYRGTLFAVYDFLEQDLGCRWYFPGEYGEVLPSTPTLSIGDIDRVERPSFRVRDIWYSGWMPQFENSAADFRVWYDKNKCNRFNLSLPGDGTITGLAPPEEYFESHPEIFATGEDGERQREMLCMSEPEGVRIGAETIKQFFRDNPDALTFGFAPADGYPMCYCERCQRFFPGFSGFRYGDPSLSDVWFNFANQVAAEVYKEFPDRWVLTNGYANRVRPPEVVKELSPNLGIQSAMLGTCTIHRIGDPGCWQRLHYQQVLDRWTGALDPILIYDYDPGKALENLPFPTLHCLKADFPYFKERGVWGFWTEGTNSWMVTHLNYYIRAKLMWDAEVDVDALVRDYCEKFYGEAASAVEEYIWALEKAVDTAGTHQRWGDLMLWRLILTPVKEKLDTLIGFAEAQAADEKSQLHVRVLRLVHDHMMAYYHMETAAAEGNFTEAVAQTDRMLAIREECHAINPNLLPYSSELAADYSSSVEKHREVYQGLADRADGATGQLLALLPRTWEFKQDPEGVGSLYQWYLPETESDWTPIDVTFPWEVQGNQDDRGWGYWDKAWYRTAFEVPTADGEKEYRLTFGGVYSNGVWVWINGVLRPFQTDPPTKRGIPHSKYPFDIDVTDLIKPGETNHVAVLVDTRRGGDDTRSGLHRRVLLWSPN